MLFITPAAPGEGSRVRSGSRILALVLLCASLGGCLGYDGDVQHGYQMSPQALADVRTGQTAEQVLVTLGTPSTTSTVGGDAWYYVTQKTDRSIAFMKPTLVDQRIYAVYFDKGKKVTRVADYGMQDGKVINFASGATPTSGNDNSFLSSLFLNVNPLAGMMQKG